MNLERSKQATARAVKYNREHPKQRAKAVKKYKTTHAVKIKEDNKKYRVDHADEIKVYEEKRKLTTSSKYSTLKSVASRRGLECLLSLDEYKAVIANPCYYCGGDLPPTGSGTDRVDSSIGYIVGNVRACCMVCNRSKSDSTENEFKDWIIRTYIHWIKP